MKETKKFFNNDNKLNKGYNKASNLRENNNNNFYRKKFEHILPPIDLMSEYENIYPGTLEKLIEMSQKEQAHRHEIDLKNLKIYEKTVKINKICVLLFGIFLLSSIIFLTISEGFIASGIVLLCFICMLSVFLKRTKNTEYIKNKMH